MILRILLFRFSGALSGARNKAPEFRDFQNGKYIKNNTLQFQNAELFAEHLTL